jgi:hypothetical protein
MPKWKVVARTESHIIVEAPDAALAIFEAGHVWGENGEKFPDSVPDVKFYVVQIEADANP